MRPRVINDAQGLVAEARGALVRRDYAQRLGALDKEQQFKAEAEEIIARIPNADLADLWPSWEFELLFGVLR